MNIYYKISESNGTFNILSNEGELIRSFPTHQDARSFLINKGLFHFPIPNIYHKDPI